MKDIFEPQQTAEPPHLFEQLQKLVFKHDGFPEPGIYNHQDMVDSCLELEVVS